MLDEIDLLNPSVWDGVSDEVQLEILRQAEMMIKGSITVALGGDQRATTAMNIFGAGAVALLAAAATLIASNRTDIFLISAPLVGAIGLFSAAVLCGYAIAPVNFLLSGARPMSM
jgi:hypothetical protein